MNKELNTDNKVKWGDGEDTKGEKGSRERENKM